MNGTFQKEMKSIFENMDPSCFFSKAPVKKRERCIIKSQTEYANKP